MFERPISTEEKTVDSAIVRMPPPPSKRFMVVSMVVLGFLVVFWAIPWVDPKQAAHPAWFAVISIFRSWIFPLALLVSIVMDHVLRGKEAFHFLIRLAGVAALLFIGLLIWLLFGLKNFW